MMALDANFSMPAKPPAQAIGVSGFEAKVFGVDGQPPMPPAPTPEQLMSRQFPPEVLRFYLTKRQAEQIHAPASVEGEVWRYAWGERVRDVKLPMPQDGQDIERAAVAEIAAVEGIEPDRARLYVAQVASANWGEFVRFAAGDAPAQPQELPTPQVTAAQLHEWLRQVKAERLDERSWRYKGRVVDVQECGDNVPALEAIAAAEGWSVRQVAVCVAAMHMQDGAQEGKPAPQVISIKDELVKLLVQAKAEDEARHAQTPPAAPESAPEAQTWSEKRLPIVHPPYASAPETLKRAAQLLQERGQQYDATSDEAPHEARERSMARTVETFNALHGTRLTEAQGWSFMLCLKLVRLFCAPGFHADSADDAVAYAALLGEGKAREV